MSKYRAGVIGLGWMGLLYDLAGRLPYRLGIDTADSIDKPTPELDVHRRFHLYEQHLPKGTPTSYSEALHDRSEIDLVAGCDRDPKRLQAFGDRYGEVALYTDGEEMLEKEKLDIVAIATNTKSRPELVRLAVENGAKAVVTDKPMCHTLAEADLMVGVCRDAGVPLSCGAISTTHPSFAKAKGTPRIGRNRRRDFDGNVGPARSAAPELVVLPQQRTRMGRRHSRSAAPRNGQQRVQRAGTCRLRGRNDSPLP